MIEKGDLVFVPNAYNNTFEPYYAEINDIYTENGRTYYTAICPHLNSFVFNDTIRKREKTFLRHEIFHTKEECEEYIKNYYYDNLCRGCEYDAENGHVWTCADCASLEKCKKPDNAGEITYKCRKNGIKVGQQCHKFFEICRYYRPTLPQNERAYKSWFHYMGMLLNCEYNTECALHSQSCHKTCTYDKYMNQLIRIPFAGKYEGRAVKSILVQRKAWVYQNFINDDGVLRCYGIKVEPERTKSGKVKKGEICDYSFSSGCLFITKENKIISKK